MENFIEHSDNLGYVCLGYPKRWMKRFTIKRIATNYGTKACRIDIRKHNY